MATKVATLLNLYLDFGIGRNSFYPETGKCLPGRNYHKSLRDAPRYTMSLRVLFHEKVDLFRVFY